MPIKMDGVEVSQIGTWQEVFEKTCSDRVKKAIQRAVRVPEVCLERARSEMAVSSASKEEPPIIQRARLLEHYLKNKTVFIQDGELIVGNVNSKVRGSVISGVLYAEFLDAELDHPERDFQIRQPDKHTLTSEERREIKEVIVPFFKGKTLQEYIYGLADEDVKEKGFVMTASCPHIPNFADLLVQQDAGHTLVNYEKVLHKGLNGIKEDVQRYLAELSQPYMHYNNKKKADFYNACLISLDAAIDYAKRYADLAREMATREPDQKRKVELEKIAQVLDKVPAGPATTWWEALQSVWFTQLLLYCEQVNYANSFGRFDQYVYPFYEQSVLKDEEITRDEALELLECFWIKTAEFTELYNYDTALVQTGYPLSQNLLIGGQTRDGKDACNEVTMLCLEAEEQVGLIQPEVALRICETTPQEILKKAVEVVRLGRGKLKFYSDRTAIKMEQKAYPEMAIEDCRDYAVIGCIEIALPHITQQHSFTGLTNVAKIVELTLTNGKCSICGKQIGPRTGDPRTFESMENFKQAYRRQVFYWMEQMCKAICVEMKGQADMMQLPFTSTLLEGPLQKGLDMMEGGCWYTSYGVLAGGIATAGDSLAAIEKLIYRDKSVGWDGLLEAIKSNWDGFDELRARCVNLDAKYGNDDDYADAFTAYVMDVWYDAVDWANTQNKLLPPYGGTYRGAVLIGNGAVGFGAAVGGLPDGHKCPEPLSDTLSPVQGRDQKGPTAVIRSVSKMPAARYAMGTALNQRLSPQLLVTDRDLDNFVGFLRAFEELGVYHIQFNVISSETLRRAMETPDNYRDLMVRVASYCAYFTELDKMTQLDIINRTEQKGW